MSLFFYTIDINYIEYLRQFDNKIPMEHQEGYKRPYVGILLEINKCKYFAPMSSPKNKHKHLNGIDIYKIANGKYGVINFNNMIPVPDGTYHLLAVANEENAYKELLYNQYRNILKDEKIIKNQARRLHGMYVHGYASRYLMNRCCDFKVLEKAAMEYSVS